MLHAFYNPSNESFKILKYDYEVRDFINLPSYSGGQWKYIQLSPDDCIAKLMQLTRNETPSDAYCSDEPI
jgi:hypothetical protein